MSKNTQMGSVDEPTGFELERSGSAFFSGAERKKKRGATAEFAYCVFVLMHDEKLSELLDEETWNEVKPILERLIRGTR